MSESRKSTVTTVPFVKSNNIDYYEVFSFIQDGKTKRACGWILFVLVTTFGLHQNVHSGIFQHVVTIDHLFQQPTLI